MSFPTRAAGSTACKTEKPWIPVQSWWTRGRGSQGKQAEMHLDEEVKPVAQKPLVLNWGHAGEQLEEKLLLLGGRWKHVLRLNVLSSSFGRGGESDGGGQDWG